MDVAEQLPLLPSEDDGGQSPRPEPATDDSNDFHSEDVCCRMDFAYKAAIIKCCVPDPHFSEALALWCTGMKKEECIKRTNQETVANITSVLRTEKRIVVADRSNTQNLIERAKILVSHANRVPKNSMVKKNGYFPSMEDLDRKENDWTKVATVTECCYLAGFKKKMLCGVKTKPEYQQVFQYEKKSKKRDSDFAALTATTPLAHHDLHLNVHFGHQRQPVRQTSTRSFNSPQENSSQQLSSLAEDHILDDDLPAGSIGIISHSIEDQSLVSQLSNEFSFDETENQMTCSEASAGSSRNTRSLASFSSGPISKANYSFSKKVNQSVIRKTAKQANQEKHDNEAWRQLKDCSYEIATKMYDRKKKNKLPLNKFKGADDIAAFINTGFECNLIDGEMIRSAHSKGFVGEAPKRHGRKPKIEQEDTELLANLLFTTNSIDQANADPKRMGRTTQASAIAKIVNAKLESDGIDVIMDTSTYFSRNIEPVLSRGSSVKTLDLRELLRLKWLTFSQQKQHYINWEKHIVELGFARHSITPEELANGNVVFFDGALERMIHIDEMGFSFDGTKNGIGGREEAHFTNELIPDAGVAVAKSSAKVSVLFSATYAGRPLPPMIILPSKAENPSLPIDLMLNLHQVKGKFGWKEERAFDCVVGKKVNRVLFITKKLNFILTIVSTLRFLRKWER